MEGEPQGAGDRPQVVYPQLGIQSLSKRPVRVNQFHLFLMTIRTIVTADKPPGGSIRSQLSLAASARSILSFPNSVWERRSGKLRFPIPWRRRQRLVRETEFRGVRSQTEFGNERMREDFHPREISWRLGGS